MFGDGPARRYAGQAKPGKSGFQGQTILPGGASGVIGSPFYVNLLP